MCHDVTGRRVPGTPLSDNRSGRHLSLVSMSDMCQSDIISKEMSDIEIGFNYLEPCQAWTPTFDAEGTCQTCSPRTYPSCICSHVGYKKHSRSVTCPGQRAHFEFSRFVTCPGQYAHSSSSRLDTCPGQCAQSSRPETCPGQRALNSIWQARDLPRAACS